MKEMEERARQLIDIARAGHNPGPVDAARVRAALKARVLSEPALLQASTKPALESSLLRKLALAFGAGSGAGFAAGLYVAQTLTARTPEVPAALAPVAVMAPAVESASAEAPAAEVAAASQAPAVRDSLAAEEASAPVVASDSRRKPVEVQSAATRSAKASNVNGPNPLKAELDGLRRAQELLHQGQPAWAVARLNELDRAQVGSVLLEERAATRAIAECTLRHDPNAQARDFERRFPRSAHLEQVRASCLSAHQTGTPESASPRQTENTPSHHE